MAPEPTLEAPPGGQPPAYELYAFWRSAASYRVRVALAMKGLTAHEHVIDLEMGAQHSAAYRAVNALGGLPTLVEPGHAPITQSLAILEFLEDVQPTPALLPADPRGRARVRSLSGMIASDTHPLVTPRIRKYLAATSGIDDTGWRTWQTHWFETGLHAVEQRLSTEAGTGLFCHGDSPTMADICLASVVAVMRVLKIHVDHTPTIDRIIGQCDGVEAFAKAHPGRQLGAPVG
ncbi:MULTISPECIES: maleylacetoacetate isomerase [unclassified Acidovorax]|uniref:maleylacetoacetate isomerase n=1 Tax=unclassified Acidovorax TaxID=2684926 RepID=UPI002883299A|nr:MULTISPECIES: maleylacetoacetate isomerase [unclassified Acidovorax]